MKLQRGEKNALKSIERKANSYFSSTRTLSVHKIQFFSSSVQQDDEDGKGLKLEKKKKKLLATALRGVRLAHWAGSLAFFNQKKGSVTSNKNN